MVQPDRKDVAAAKIINAGPMRTLLNMGCSPWSQPMDSQLILVEVEPPTGEPCAGEPHARFGGRGDANQCVIPTPIFHIDPMGLIYSLG